MSKARKQTIEKSYGMGKSSKQSRTNSIGGNPMVWVILKYGFLGLFGLAVIAMGLTITLIQKGGVGVEDFLIPYVSSIWGIYIFHKAHSEYNYFKRAGQKKRGRSRPAAAWTNRNRRGGKSDEGDEKGNGKAVNTPKPLIEPAPQKPIKK